MNSHLFFPIAVEYILCACDLEEGTLNIRHSGDPLLKRKTIVTETSLPAPDVRHLLSPLTPLGVLSTSSPGVCNLLNVASALSAQSQCGGPEGTFDEGV